jgi:hypothetical protein
MNGLGWYLHNLTESNRNDPCFDAMALAMATLRRSFLCWEQGTLISDGPIAVPSGLLRQRLKQAGFTDIDIAAEGTLHPAAHTKAPTPFFQGTYLGEEGVYEIFCRKPGRV